MSDLERVVGERLAALKPSDIPQLVLIFDDDGEQYRLGEPSFLTSEARSEPLLEALGSLPAAIVRAPYLVPVAGIYGLGLFLWSPAISSSRGWDMVRAGIIVTRRDNADDLIAILDERGDVLPVNSASIDGRVKAQLSSIMSAIMSGAN